jgi:hypothetical protein
MARRAGAPSVRSIPAYDSHLAEVRILRSKMSGHPPFGAHYTTCLCFALDLKEKKRSAFRYQYSVFQMEYSRNLLFSSGRQMDQVFQALIDRTRGHWIWTA